MNVFILSIRNIRTFTFVIKTNKAINSEKNIIVMFANMSIGLE